MKRNVVLINCLAVALFTLSGCVVLVGPGWYRPPPAQPAAYYPAPPCPAGFAWVPGSGCAPIPAGPPQAPVYARVSASYLNMRACPGLDCQTVMVLNLNQVVQILEIKEGWTRVWSQDNQAAGWVSSRYLTNS